MNGVLVLTIMVLLSSGLYLMLRGSWLKVIMGFGLLSHGVNLILLTSGGTSRRSPPIISELESTLAAGTHDPLPQALVLTAIVIAFGLQIFLLALFGLAWNRPKEDNTKSSATLRGKS